MSDTPNFARIKELISMAEQEVDARFAASLLTDALWVLVQIVEQQCKRDAKS